MQRLQTWRNVAYLLLAFPMGLFSFAFAVTGLALGFGLLPVLVGIPVLVGVLSAVHGIADIERRATNAFLEGGTPWLRPPGMSGRLWARLQALVASRETWKRVGYLLAEFPFGVLGVVLVACVAGLFLMILTPLFYAQPWWPTHLEWSWAFWSVDTLWESVIVAAISVTAGLVLLEMCGALARAWGRFAESMLGPSVQMAHIEDRLFHEVRM
jgi:hypothetical protein